MELLVVVAILSALVTLILVTINPIRQLSKAKDAQRQHDLFQIRNALDTYYNDTNCYPTLNTFSFGSKFSQGNTVYIQKVPQDPDYSAAGSSYIYEIDNSQSCPQWNVIFAKLSSAESLQNTVPCPLSQLKDSSGNACLPPNYQSLGYNYCVVSGKVNCDYVTVNPLVIPTPAPSVSPTQAPTFTPTPSPSPSPTPTPVPVNCYPNYYAVTGGGLCNYLGTDPLNQCTIHGGSYVCYSGPGSTSCSGLACTQ